MKNNSPSVSVIIPTHNNEKTIGESVESILSQSYGNFELIIINDGSTDNTAQVVANYKDRRIRYEYQENQERAIARNKGIELARGEYIAFLDADDLWLPEKLAEQLRLFESNPRLGLIFCDLYYYDATTGSNLFRYSSKTKLHRGIVPLRAILERNFIQSPTPILRAEVFNIIGLFDPGLITVEDWDLWIRVIAQYPIDFVDRPLARYRVGTDAIRWNNQPDMQYRASLKMFDQLADRQNTISGIASSDLNRGRMLAHYNQGLVLREIKDYQGARSYLNKAIACNPFYWKSYARMIQLSGEQAFYSRTDGV